MDGLNIQPGGPLGQPVVPGEGLGAEFGRLGPFGKQAYIADPGTLAAQRVHVLGGPPPEISGGPPPGAFEPPPGRAADQSPSGSPPSGPLDATTPAGSQDIFAAAARRLAADAARSAERQAALEKLKEESRRKEENFQQARQQLRQLNAQIPELYARLMRAGVPPSKTVGSKPARLRGLLTRPEGPRITAKADGRSGWPLAEIALEKQRFGAVGGDPYSGTKYGMRTVAVGSQGVALLTDGGLYEYRRFKSNPMVLEIGAVYDRDIDLPPDFAMPQVVADRGNKLIEEQTFAIRDWTGMVRAAMETLATEALRLEQ